MYSKKNLYHNYWAAKLIENTYIPISVDKAGNHHYVTNSTDTYMVSSYDQIPTSISYFLYEKMLNNENIRQFIVQRKLHLLMVKTSNKQCPRDLPESVCPETPSTNLDNMDKEPLGNGSQYWQNWHSAEDNQIKFDIKGQLNTYKGDGFKKSLYINENYTKAMLDDELAELKKDGFFDDKNLAIILLFEYYMPDFDLWTLNYVTYENTFTGYQVMTPMRSHVFRPNIQETPTEKVIVMCDSLCFMLALALLGVCALELYLTVKRSGENKRFTLMRMFKFSNITILTAFIAYCYVAAALYSLRRDTAGILQGNVGDENFYELHEWYQGIIYAQYLAFICLIGFLFRWVKIFSWSRDLIFVLRKSTFPILSFLLYGLLLCLCLVIFLHQIYGNYRYIYRHILASVVTVLQMYHTRDDLSAFEPTLTGGIETIIVIFTFVFIFCVSFSFPAFVAAIFLDSMRKLNLLHESLKDRPQGVKPDTWTDLKDRIKLKESKQNCRDLGLAGRYEGYNKMGAMLQTN